MHLVFLPYVGTASPSSIPPSPKTNKQRVYTHATLIPVCPNLGLSCHKQPLLVMKQKQFSFRDQLLLLGATATELLQFDCEVPLLTDVRELPLSHRPR